MRLVWAHPQSNSGSIFQVLGNRVGERRGVLVGLNPLRTRFRSPSRRRGSHPPPLTEPCIRLSTYTARGVHPAVPGWGQPCRLVPPGWLAHPTVPDAPPPSLDPHYRASSLLRGGP